MQQILRPLMLNRRAKSQPVHAGRLLHTSCHEQDHARGRYKNSADHDWPTAGEVEIVEAEEVLIGMVAYRGID